MVKISRRGLIKIGSGSAVTGALSGLSLGAQAGPNPNTGVLPNYPKDVLTKAESLVIDQPFFFHYPDEHSPCVLLKMSNSIPGGVGDRHNIVAYSVLCSHQGCVVNYDANAKTFKCPCHFSIFDPEQRGQMVCGQAVDDLPRIVLRHNPETDELTAVAVEGLIYGRNSNILAKG